MIALLHHEKHRAEFLEIHTLPSFERVLNEEWNDVLEQMLVAWRGTR